MGQVFFVICARKTRRVGSPNSELGERQVEIWLKHLSNDRDVSANTQNQAFSALCYLLFAINDLWRTIQVDWDWRPFVKFYRLTRGSIRGNFGFALS